MTRNAQRGDRAETNKGIERVKSPPRQFFSISVLSSHFLLSLIFFYEGAHVEERGVSFRPF